VPAGSQEGFSYGPLLGCCRARKKAVMMPSGSTSSATLNP
jgi:hypothetical protein